MVEKQEIWEGNRPGSFRVRPATSKSPSLALNPTREGPIVRRTGTPAARACSGEKRWKIGPWLGTDPYASLRKKVVAFAFMKSRQTGEENRHDHRAARGSDHRGRLYRGGGARRAYVGRRMERDNQTPELPSAFHIPRTEQEMKGAVRLLDNAERLEAIPEHWTSHGLRTFGPVRCGS